MPAISPAALWTGRSLSAVVVAFLLLDGAIKLIPIAPVTETLQLLGFNVTDGLARGIGVLTLLCAILYAIPRTSLLGAILLTGLLGGAMATHLRAESPLFSHLLFGFYVGVVGRTLAARPHAARAAAISEITHDIMSSSARR